MGLKNIKSWLVFSLSGLLLFACTEVIDLDLQTESERLVVEGLLNNQQRLQVVRLSLSVPYFYDAPAPPVEGADVSVFYRGIRYGLEESEEHPGFYYIEPSRFLLEPGGRYELQIRDVHIPGVDIPDSYSAVTTMPRSVKGDSIDLRLRNDWEIWQVRAWFQDPPDEENFYLFRVVKNDYYLTTRPNEWTISNDAFIDGNYVNGVWVQSISAKNNMSLLSDGDNVILEISTITEPFYHFMDALQQEYSGSSPLFGGPPANVPGNISNGALGFFTVIAIEPVLLEFDSQKHNQ